MIIVCVFVGHCGKRVLSRDLPRAQGAFSLPRPRPGQRHPSPLRFGCRADSAQLAAFFVDAFFVDAFFADAFLAGAFRRAVFLPAVFRVVFLAAFFLVAFFLVAFFFAGFFFAAFFAVFFAAAVFFFFFLPVIRSICFSTCSIALSMRSAWVRCFRAELRSSRTSLRSLRMSAASSRASPMVFFRLSICSRSSLRVFSPVAFASFSAFFCMSLRAFSTRLLAFLISRIKRSRSRLSRLVADSAALRNSFLASCNARCCFLTSSIMVVLHQRLWRRPLPFGPPQEW